MITSFNGKTPRIADSACISETACIVGDVEIGENCILSPGAVLRGDIAAIKVGQNVWIEDNCVLHAGPDELIIGDNVTLGHGSVANCSQIGNNVLVGMNATLLHRAVIGNNCIIGAMTLVREGMKIPDRSFVTGVPGKINGQVTEKQLTWVTRDPKAFSQFVKQYKLGKLDKEALSIPAMRPAKRPINVKDQERP